MKFILLSLVTLQFSLLADKVVVKDGSVIIGSVLDVVDGNLTIETDFAGKLRIPVSEISSISSDAAMSLRMDDNRTFNDAVTPAAGGKVGLQGNDLSLDFAQIRHIWSEDSEDPLIRIEQQKQKALLMKWSHALGFDFTGSSGNTQDFGLGLRADSTYGNKFREYDLYLSYNNSSKKDVIVVDETKFGVEYDSKFHERLAWYAKTDLENDRLEKIDLRATAALGLKYFWVKNNSYDLSARSGLAFRFEEYQSSSNATLSEPALDFGLEYSRKIRNFLSLEGDLTYVPSVNDFTDFLLSNDFALVVPLDKEDDWNLRSGINGTYNSTPATDKDELDLKYYLRLVYRLN
jgi:putative salt-induced outer membrane protein YdiY